MRKQAVPESLWAPRPEQALPHQPYPAKYVPPVLCLSRSTFRRLPDSPRRAPLVADLATPPPSLRPPQAAPQATPPARQPTSSAKLEPTSLKIRQIRFSACERVIYFMTSMAPQPRARCSATAIVVSRISPSTDVPRQRPVSATAARGEIYECSHHAPGLCFFMLLRPRCRVAHLLAPIFWSERGSDYGSSAPSWRHYSLRALGVREITTALLRACPTP